MLRRRRERKQARAELRKLIHEWRWAMARRGETQYLDHKRYSDGDILAGHYHLARSVAQAQGRDVQRADLLDAARRAIEMLVEFERTEQQP